MWPNEFAAILISFFGITDQASQGAAVIVSLSIYAAVIIAVVGAIVFVVENVNE